MPPQMNVNSRPLSMQSQHMMKSHAQEKYTSNSKLQQVQNSHLLLLAQATLICIIICFETQRRNHRYVKMQLIAQICSSFGSIEVNCIECIVDMYSKQQNLVFITNPKFNLGLFGGSTLLRTHLNRNMECKYVFQIANSNFHNCSEI